MLHRREVAALSIAPRRGHVRGRDLRMRQRAVAFDCLRMIELQRPERQVIRVAAEVTHRPVGETPVTIPAADTPVTPVNTPASDTPVTPPTPPAGDNPVVPSN